MSKEAVEKEFQAAIRHQSEGDMPGAEALYRRVLQAVPDLPEALCNLGIVLHAQRRFPESLACLLKALKSRRKEDRIYGNLGNVLREMGWQEEAAACYRRAGELRRLRGESAGAVLAYESALAATPTDFSTRLYLGAALLRLNRFADATRYLGPAKAQLDDLALYADFMAQGKSVASVGVDGKTLRFHVGRVTSNFGVDMSHIKGRFYEQEELEYCRSTLKRGAAIVDVGANTGNHLVFFAALLDPTVIFPVEPHPGAIRELRENIALNGIRCVDERCLGFGAGGTRAKFKLVEGVDWAQAALAPAADGAIEVAPLDDLIQAKVDFMKIDVEGMEIEVLQGARGLIGRNRPRILIEAQDRNAQSLLRLCQDLRYAVECKFAHEGYANYFLAPLS